MAAEAEGNIIGYYTYTGADGERIPDETTHVIIKDVTSVRAWAFDEHQNIVEVICHDGVERIERWSFSCCPSLRRVIMPGVKIIEEYAFTWCTALTDVECGELEMIEQDAFRCCTSLRNINLPSGRIVESCVFENCSALTEAKFGSKLEKIEGGTFKRCASLERITIPLKDGLISRDDTFAGCENLNQVTLIGEVHETTAALQLEEWRNDMNCEIDSINSRILLPERNEGWDEGKAQLIRMWIRSVLNKIVHYKAEHRRVLREEAATTLQLALPRDIVMSNVLPFLALPSHAFEGEDEPSAEVTLDLALPQDIVANMDELVNHHFFDSSVAQWLMIVSILTGGVIILGISIHYAQQEF